MRTLTAIAILLLAPQEKPAPTGEQLIEQLKDEKTRVSAFYELSRRAGDRKAKTETAFRESRRNPELVVCPQGEGKPPIYMLLTDFLTVHRDDKVFGGPDDRLFKPAVPGTRRKEKAIDAFTASGAVVRPFGTANVLTDGFLADLNGDGLVEMANKIGYYAQDFSVLEISVVREKAQRIFAVVYATRHGEDWGFDLVDQDGDGRREILLGPLGNDAKVVPEVRFTWDAAKQTYVGPRGQAGDHFRVIDPADVEKELKRLVEEKTVFPGVKGPQSFGRTPAAVAPPQEKSYASVSLKGVPDELLFAFMGRGAQAGEQNGGKRTVEPPKFWTLDPKAAALALVEANRSAKHRALVELAMDDKDGPPGGQGFLRFTQESSRCYVAADRHFLLRCDPKESFLILASSEQGGVVAKENGQKGQTQDLRLCSLEYKEAAHLFQVIGWLNRIRSRSAGVDRSNSFGSTGDGRGVLKLIFMGDPAIPPIEADGSLWCDEISERWSSLYTKDAYLNFASYLIGTLAQRRLQNRQTPEFELFDRQQAPPIPQEALKDQERACARVLELHLADPAVVPAPIVKTACGVAGELSLASLSPLLEKLQDRGKDGGAPAEALRKIDAARDPAALEKMVLSNGARSEWALFQLQTRFPDRHARTLEALVGTLRGREAAQRLAELARVDVARARAVAAAIRPSDRSPLGTAAVAVLREDGRMDREEERVKAQLETALDPMAKPRERSESIDVLMPPGNPLRFSQPEIDAALEQILKEKPGERFEAAPIRAASALERRRGAAPLELVLSRIRKTTDPFASQQLLGVAAAMSQSADDHGRSQVENILLGHLLETNLMMSEVCREIWAADFRSSRGTLERLATAGAEVPESERADTSGGPVQPVTGKFHRARQVLQLWNEEDSTTRAKLLVAFALHEAYDYVGDRHPGLRRRFDRSLAEATKELSAAQKQEVSAFAAAFAPKSIASGAETLAAAVREALK